MRKLSQSIQYHRLVELFKQVYEKETKETGYFNGKHYKLSKLMVDKFGLDPVIEKARRLYILCKEHKEFFVKKGFADFTLENLSVHWNRLVGIKSKQEQLNESLEQRRKANERIAKILDRGR
jgi:hypothetical protein